MMIYRCIASFMIGASLTQIGGLIQCLTGNQLASTSTLGLDALAVLSVLCAHVLLTCWQWGIELSHLSCLLSLVGLVIGVVIYQLFFIRKQQIFGSMHRNFSSKLILLGICFNMFVGAIFSILHFIFVAINFPFPHQLWYGHVKFADSTSTLILLGVGIVTYIGIYRLAPQIQLLSFGDQLSNNFRMDKQRLVKISLLLSWSILFIIVSYFGVFLFLGIVFPHAMRKISFFRRNIIAELRIAPLLAGIVFLLLDLFCYEFPIWGAEIPLGMISSTVGAFILTLLLVKDYIRNTT